MDHDQRGAFLWETIGRIDQNISATNTKAGMILALNTFLLGGAALQADRYLKPLLDDGWWWGGAVALIALLGAACFVSMLITFSVIQPFLNPSKGFQDYKSLIFFGDIASHADGRAYAMAHQQQGHEELLEDLARQAHVVADIAKTKFDRLRLATRLAVFFQFPLLAGLLLIQLVTAAGSAS